AVQNYGEREECLCEDCKCHVTAARRYKKARAALRPVLSFSNAEFSTENQEGQNARQVEEEAPETPEAQAQKDARSLQGLEERGTAGSAN
ncbi:MAG: hypothetical protein BJ554DRAFT_3372, partial [Olpidium bornovanus]